MSLRQTFPPAGETDVPPPRRYASPRALRDALEARLRDQARREGGNPQRLWTLVAFDRLLARLLGGDSPTLVLKGGYAMELRVARARVTRDVDVSLASVEALGEEPGEDLDARLLRLLQGLAAHDAGDFFSFTIGESMMDLDAAPYGGARFPVESRLDGRTFSRFHLDVGAGDAVTGAFEETEGRDWLGFAGLSPPRIRMISKEQQFAEKLHAYTLPREGGPPNTRVKDLVDLVLLVGTGALDRVLVGRALRATFARRSTHALPSGVPDPPGDWAGSYRSLADECGINLDVGAGLSVVREFLDR